LSIGDTTAATNPLIFKGSISITLPKYLWRDKNGA
jgi:hypothetical protein